MTVRSREPRTALRAAVDADLDALRGVFRRSALHGESDRAWLLAHPEHLLWDGAGIGSGGTRVACVDGRIAGFATAAPIPEGVELVDLFVDPWAMRRGVARALVRDLVERAGPVPVWVTANPNALAFYRAVGFVEVGVAATERIPAPRLRLDPR